MPRPTREERREERARTALRWGACLKDAMATAGVDPEELITRTRELGATFDKTNISHWRAGRSPANMENVLYIAQALDRDPVPMLRAAGHDAFADQIVKLVEEAIHGERLLAQQKDQTNGDNDRTAV